MEIIGKKGDISKKINKFVVINSGSASQGMVWDSLKVFLRGILLQNITRVKRQSREKGDQIRKEVRDLEKQYVADPSPGKQQLWVEKQQEYKMDMLKNTENKRLFQRQRHFGEGEKVGRMLALLADTNSPSSTIAAIRTSSGTATSDPLMVKKVFFEYYSNLYKSQQQQLEVREIENFLEGVSLPHLSESERASLDSPITFEEVQQAVLDMPNQKAPGPDGLPVEIYKYFGEALIPELLKTLNWAITDSTLPASMTETNIVLIKKEGKDHLEAASYRPISLLRSDIKILAKIMATRLKKYVLELVHPDQSGFIPNRSTSINIRRAYLNLQSPAGTRSSRAVLTLDIAKAFDSLEWEYLWWVLEKFRFCPKFIKWVKTLYFHPKARLKINSEYTEWLSLERGMRQGCPLSPLLFALVMEPLAEVIRHSPGTQGFGEGNGSEKMTLYADDVLIFLGDTGPSFEKAIQLLERFGRSSGLVVNWEKSTLLPLDSTRNSQRGGMPRLRVVEKMRYLGIVISTDPVQYIGDNLVPLFEKFRRKSAIWCQLPLSLAGRVNLIKMVWMPQLLYVLLNSPVWIGKTWFQKLNTIFRELIWKKGQARIKLQTLQRPVGEGRLAVPHPYSYFLAAQLQHLGGCENQGRSNSNAKLLMQDTPYGSLALEAGIFQEGSPTYKLIINVWQATKRIMGYGGYTEFSPIWDNRGLRELLTLEKNWIWVRHGIRRLVQLFEGKNLKPFIELGREYGIPNNTFYTYLQIRHALNSQFSNCPLEWCNVPLLNKIIRANSTKGLIAIVSGHISVRLLDLQTTLDIRERWTGEVGEITDSQWKGILKASPLVSVSPSQQVSHLFLIHRAYYTPKRLFRFGRRLDDKCPRCLDTGDLIHMVWRCPRLARYWSKIIRIIEIRFKSKLKQEARVCILGLLGESVECNNKKIAIGRCLYQARKLIAQSWLSSMPPTIKDWLRTVDKLVWTEKTVYIRRSSYDKFTKIWNSWLEWSGIVP